MSPLPSAPPSPDVKPLPSFTPKAQVAALIKSLAIPRANHLPELPFLMMLPSQYVQDFEADSAGPSCDGGVARDQAGAQGQGQGGTSAHQEQQTNSTFVQRMAAFSPRFSAFSPQLSAGLQVLHRGSRLHRNQSDSLSRSTSGLSLGSARCSSSRSRSPPHSAEPEISPLTGSNHPDSLAGNGKEVSHDGGSSRTTRCKDVVLSVEPATVQQGEATPMDAAGDKPGTHTILHTQISLFPSPCPEGSFSILKGAGDACPPDLHGGKVPADVEAGCGAREEASGAVASWAEAAREVARESGGGDVGGSSSKGGGGGASQSGGVASPAPAVGDSVEVDGAGEGSLIEHDMGKSRVAAPDEVSPLIGALLLSADASPLMTCEAAQGRSALSPQAIGDQGSDGPVGSEDVRISGLVAESAATSGATGDDSVDYDV